MSRVRFASRERIMHHACSSVLCAICSCDSRRLVRTAKMRKAAARAIEPGRIHGGQECRQRGSTSRTIPGALSPWKCFGRCILRRMGFGLPVCRAGGGLSRKTGEEQQRNRPAQPNHPLEPASHTVPIDCQVKKGCRRQPERARDGEKVPFRAGFRAGVSYGPRQDEGGALQVISQRDGERPDTGEDEYIEEDEKDACLYRIEPVHQLPSGTGTASDQHKKNRKGKDHPEAIGKRWETQSGRLPDDRVGEIGLGQRSKTAKAALS